MCDSGNTARSSNRASMNAGELVATWKIKTLASDGIEHEYIKTGAQLWAMAHNVAATTGLQLRTNASISHVHAMLCLASKQSTRQRRFKNKTGINGSELFGPEILAWDELGDANYDH